LQKGPPQTPICVNLSLESDVSRRDAEIVGRQFIAGFSWKYKDP